MKLRRAKIFSLPLLTMGLVLMASGARGEVVGCDQLNDVKTHNRYVFDAETCNFAEILRDKSKDLKIAKETYEQRKIYLTSIISILDQQIIAPMSEWLDPEKAVSQITIQLYDANSALDGEFKPETPTTIYLRDDIFSGPERAFVAFHELQHLYNFHFKGKAYIDDWLNEGLSEFVQFQFTNTVPHVAIDRMRQESRTPSLIDFSNEAADIEGRIYTNTGLFVAYLARHFGGLDFIRETIRSPLAGIDALQSAAATMRQRGAHNIEDDYINLNSLFLNYSVALTVNSARYSHHELFALVGDIGRDVGGDGFYSQFSALHIDGQLLVLPVVYDHLEQKDNVQPYQTEYYVVPSDYKCLQVSSTGPTEFYKISSRDPLKFERVADEVAGEAISYELLIVNYDQSSQVTLSSRGCSETRHP
jgi:hypothetical protein